MERRASSPGWTGQGARPSIVWLPQSGEIYALPAGAAIAFGGSGLFCTWT